MAVSRPAPWSATDRTSFAFESTAHRWPVILSQAIDGLYQAASAISTSSSAPDADARAQEGKSIIARLSQLKHDLGRDRPLEPLPQDGGPSVSHYNEVISQQSATWFNVPWLFAECYLYRLVRTFFDLSQHWKHYDPFAAQKLSAFKSSGPAIEQLSKTLEEVLSQAKSSQGDAAAASDEGLKTLQAGGIGSDAQKQREKFILSGLGSLDSAWQCLAPLRKEGGGRVDIVLDNAGFELITDLMLGTWLVETGFAKQVVFHAKAIPWFVSDVTPPDFVFTVEALQEARFFQRHEQDILSSGNSSERARSSSRNRLAQADMRDFAGEQRAHPPGSRSLQYQPQGQVEPTPAPDGSRALQANRDVSQDRGRAPPAGSRSLMANPAYFQNARSRTVSPSRSFLVDSSVASLHFSDMQIREEGEQEEKEEPARGRSVRPVKTAAPPTSNRSASGFRSMSQAATTATQRLAQSWNHYLGTGQFKLSVPLATPLGVSTAAGADFWTEHHSYDHMAQVAPQLLADLRENSNLVVFKGDLNYRKLTGDLTWAPTTPFRDALGDLAGAFDLLALRTCKADVVVGLDEGVEHKVAAEDPKWRVDGKWAVVQFCPKK